MQIGISTGPFTRFHPTNLKKKNNNLIKKS